MRVLQVTKFFPPVRGGIETASYELTEGINRIGIRADVLCANESPATIHERSPMGYDIVRAGRWFQWMSTSISPALISEAASLAKRYDIVHVHMPDPMAAYALWKVRPKVPIVVHWHSDVVRQRFGKRLYEPLQSWLVRRADALIATTQIYSESSDSLRPWADKVHAIPIGISDPLPRSHPDRVAAVRARYPGKKIVLAVGRTIYYKGFDVLIRAARHLPEDTQVLIGGFGQLFEQCSRQIRELGLGNRVQMLGLLSDQDLIDHHAAADVFCLPSTARSEAFGIAMLEAMAMGKPVVSADIQGSGVSWVNRDGVTGLTVPVGEAEPLAQALGRLLADPVLAARLGSAARRRYLEAFTADDVARQVADLYAVLVSRRPRGET